MTTVNVTEARARLPYLIDLVIAGEEITISRHGKPVAVLIRCDSIRSRRTDALSETARIDKLLERGRRSPLSTTGLTADRADELVAEVRAGRRHR